MKVTAMSYGQFLINTQINYTGTYFAETVTGLDHLVHSRKLAFGTVLMDTWYATMDMMLHVGKDLGKTFYCPLKSNRLVHEGTGQSVAKSVSE